MLPVFVAILSDEAQREYGTDGKSQKASVLLKTEN
jgi:hypothetical protein